MIIHLILIFYSIWNNLAIHFQIFQEIGFNQFINL